MLERLYASYGTYRILFWNWVYVQEFFTLLTALYQSSKNLEKDASARYLKAIFLVLKQSLSIFRQTRGEWSPGVAGGHDLAERAEGGHLAGAAGLAGGDQCPVPGPGHPHRPRQPEHPGHPRDQLQVPPRGSPLPDVSRVLRHQRRTRHLLRRSGERVVMNNEWGLTDEKSKLWRNYLFSV